MGSFDDVAKAVGAVSDADRCDTNGGATPVMIDGDP